MQRGLDVEGGVYLDVRYGRWVQGQDIDNEILLNVSTRGRRGRGGRGLLEMLTGERFFPTQSGSAVHSRGFGFRPGRLRGIFTGVSDPRTARQGMVTPVEDLNALLADIGESPEVTAYTDLRGIPSQSIVEAGTALRLQEMGIGDARKDVIQLSRERSGLLDDLESDRAMAFDLTTDEGMRGYMESEMRVQRAGQVESILQSRLPEAGLASDIDLDSFDPETMTRAYGAGQKMQGTRVGEALKDILNAGSDILRSHGARKFGRGVQKTARIGGKILGHTLEGFEILDAMDKYDYFTGGAEQRITQESLDTGNITEMIDRYQLLAQERYRRSGTMAERTGDLFSLEFTPLEEDYFEREGGLRDIGDLWSGLKWAERLPVIDPAMVALDKYWEKGTRGRLVEATVDKGGRHGRDRVDQQLATLRASIERKALTMSPQARESYGQALETERGSLLREIESVGGYDANEVEAQRTDLQRRIREYEGMTDEYVDYRPSEAADAGELSSWILGSAYIRTGAQTKRETAIRNLKDQLTQLPDIRTEAAFAGLRDIRERMELMGIEPTLGSALVSGDLRVESERVLESLRVDLPTPLAGGVIESELPSGTRKPYIVPGVGVRRRGMGVIDPDKLVIPELVTDPNIERAISAPISSTPVGESDAVVLPIKEVLEQPELIPNVEPVIPLTKGIFDPSIPRIGAVTPRTIGPAAMLPKPKGQQAYMILPHLDFDTTDTSRYRDSKFGLSRQVKDRWGNEITDSEFSYKRGAPRAASPDGRTYVLDGDTLKGLLYAPHLGIMGEEKRVRYENIDTAELDPETKAKYRYRKNYTQDEVDREHGRGLEAWQIHVQAIKDLPINVRDGQKILLYLLTILPAIKTFTTVS